ncbi:hypothetical protein [Deinococcus sp. Leaf326]|uniref:hypothetical protein n=1 Tax=Deinococcus sp. Leaf326 TaxID=1736338 RepID=UPI000AB6202B|nr:hypothetical protein [Deinococcus sp. Leaf326]
MKTTITGYVKNIDESLVSKAFVRLTLDASGYKDGSIYVKDSTAEVYTNSSGKFSLSVWVNSESLKPSPYTLSVITKEKVLTLGDLYIPGGKSSLTITEVIEFSRTVTKAGNVPSLQEIVEKLLPPPVFNISETGFITFPSVAALSAAGLKNGQYAYLSSYYAGGSAGGGLLRWDAASTAAPDSGSVFKVPGKEAGRFIRLAHLEGVYSPEDFGAVGDGTTNDYPAWVALAAAASNRDGVTLNLGKRAVYHWDQYRILGGFEPQGVQPNGIKNPRFINIDGLHINGNSSTILIKGDFNRRGMRFAFAYDLGPIKMEWWDSPDDQLSLEFVHINNTTGGNFTVLGQADKMSSSAGSKLPNGATMYVGEGYGNGINLYHVTNLHWSNTATIQNQTDGLYVSGIESTLGLAEYATNQYQPSSQDLHFTNHTSRFNRRQGASLVHFRGCYFYGGDLSYTGYVGTERDGTPIEDALSFLRPAAGVDVEPFFKNHDPAPHRGDVDFGVAHFIGTKFINNYIGAIANAYAKKVDDVLYDGCFIDMRHTQHPDAWIGVNSKGSRIVNSVIHLNRNGFLFYDYDGDQEKFPDGRYAQKGVNSVISNNEIYLQRSLGYKDILRNPTVTFDNNRVFLPETEATQFDPPIYLTDTRDNYGDKTYLYGNNSNFRFTNNRIVIPYEFFSQTYSGGGYAQQVAVLSGLGAVHGNSWEVSGKKPAIWNNDSCFSVQYQSLNAEGKYIFITQPQIEHFPSDGAVRVHDLFSVVTAPYSYPAPVLLRDNDAPLRVYTGKDAELPKGVHVWHGEYVVRPFEILKPNNDQFNIFTTTPNDGETLKIVLWAEYPGVLAEYTWTGGTSFTLTGGTALSSGFPIQVEHGTPFELRTEYNALPADPLYPDRTFATGVVATFLRRFRSGDVPKFY